jgi:hypothetical protein
MTQGVRIQCLKGENKTWKKHIRDGTVEKLPKLIFHLEMKFSKSVLPC